MRRLLSQGEQSESEFESENDRFAAFCYCMPANVYIIIESTFSREQERKRILYARKNDTMNNFRYFYSINASKDAINSQQEISLSSK